MHLHFRLSLVYLNDLEVHSSLSNVDNCTLLHSYTGSAQKRCLDNGMKLNVSETTIINCI
jgi:hypothetical protein